MSDNSLSLFEEDESLDAGHRQLIGYLPSVFVMMAFPLKDTKKNVFKRSYQGRQMIVSNTTKVPFGPYGRNLLSILTTHAVAGFREEGQGVEVRYETIGELTSEMNLPKSRGGKVMEQLQCFSDCTFIFEEEVVSVMEELPFFDDELKGKRFRKTSFASGTIPFLDYIRWDQYEDETGNRKNHSFSMRLSSQFVKFCKGHAVPINYSVYSAIKSAVCKDLYVWCCYRNNAIKDNGSVFIPKELLVAQFMPVADRNAENYRSIFFRNYDYLCSALKEIMGSYYKGLCIDFEEKGIIFHKSKSVISEKDRRFMILTGFKV